jgi:hypothetical protein
LCFFCVEKKTKKIEAVFLESFEATCQIQRKSFCGQIITIEMKFSISYVIFLAFALASLIAAKKNDPKKVKAEDPKECEVCISNLESIDLLIPADKKTDKLSIEKAIGTHCTLSGFGSDWKPNPNLTSPKDVKMCYIFEPIKKSVSNPYSMGMPKKKVCQRLKKDNPEICEIKYRE